MLRIFLPCSRIIAFFIAYLLIFVLLKPVFIIVYHSLMGDIGITDVLAIIRHGLPMDCSMSGYLTIIPCLITLASLWWKSCILNIVNRIYIVLTAACISGIAVLDIVLYSYWNFRLDITPFFYFFSSPESALASTGVGTIITGIIAWLVTATIIYYIIWFIAGRIKIDVNATVTTVTSTVILTAALFIPIRGGITVSTMNLSHSYFSNNQRLNHAAINPVFSLMYSATHQTDFDTMFNFFSEDEVKELITTLHQPYAGIEQDTILTLLNTPHPDIYIIILESFSAHLMPSLGGEAVATGLDSISRNGLLFSNFYASGARTDRALPAILSAFPSQPTTSLMKFTKKIEHVSSLPRTLKEHGGYAMTYYYGGDANFTNMLAYLVSSKFDEVISDKDFPISSRTSKWGAHDHVVFDRAWSDIKSDTLSTAPHLRVIQTSSSHEPFDVPYADKRFADNPRLNAFVYADRALTNFIDSLYASPKWNNSLVIITADHYGVYPQHLENPLERHHIPLVITGGALQPAPQVINTMADQTAIASTLLNALGIDSSEFEFSKNVFDNTSKEYAFFTEPGIAAFVTPNDTAVYNLDNNELLINSGQNPEHAATLCKAMLQEVYRKLSQL